MPQPKSTPLKELEPQRVCLIKPSALGDIVQTLPVLSMLRQRWPQAHLAWVANRSLAGLLEGHPDLDEVLPFDRSGTVWRKALAARDLAHRLRRGGFDLALDFQGLLRSGLMALATRAPRRVGFSDAREGAAWTYTDRVHIETRQIPALERYRRLAAALGCSGEPPSARLGLREEHHRFAAERLEGLPRPRLAIHPGAQWQTKRWPPEYFAAVAHRAQHELGAGIILVGGPGEGPLCRQVLGHVARHRIPKLADSATGAINLAEQTSLLELAAVISTADVFLSGDTGPMHLAAAVGTPVVSLFTCTSPLRAGPRGNEARIVAAQVPCAASYLKRCPAMVCLDQLTPDRVWPVLRATLNDAKFGSRRAG
jgi:lipopolysaccharide heptosyltransferase I